MLFNSISFLIFLPIVFFAYWFIAPKRYKIQNVIILVASYYFYSCWDYRFLFLLIFSTLLDYFSGLQIHNASTASNRKIWLWISIGINLGFLGVFKYFNFFAESLADFLSFLDVKTDFYTLSLVLPVGISFYTFHGLSYVIDIYYKKIVPEKSFIDYSVFVSFFPLLVAGPIERATHLLPQLQRERTFKYDQAINGCKQILWGFFKKMVIADNCAEFSNEIFLNYSHYSGSTLFLGAVLFAFQIYGDFSGYSDIALGTARLFGIELLRNFAFPYFSRDVAEFWRRWHISLSSWFKDYLYIPLGGSKGGTLLKMRNTVIIFLVSGFWHGANWTFIVWGALNALYIMPSIIFNTNRNNIEIVAKGNSLPSFKEILAILATFILAVFAWIFFRAENLTIAIDYLRCIFSSSFFVIPEIRPLTLFLLLIFFILIEWIGRESNYALENIGQKKSKIFRWSFYAFILFLIGMYMQTKETPFIYFQF